MLKAKASAIHLNQYGNESGGCYASDVWLTKFKKSFGVKIIK